MRIAPIDYHLWYARWLSTYNPRSVRRTPELTCSTEPRFRCAQLVLVSNWSLEISCAVNYSGVTRSIYVLWFKVSLLQVTKVACFLTHHILQRLMIADQDILYYFKSFSKPLYLPGWQQMFVQWNVLPLTEKYSEPSLFVKIVIGC